MRANKRAITIAVIDTDAVRDAELRTVHCANEHRSAVDGTIRVVAGCGDQGADVAVVVGASERTNY